MNETSILNIIGFYKAYEAIDTHLKKELKNAVNNFDYNEALVAVRRLEILDRMFTSVAQDIDGIEVELPISLMDKWKECMDEMRDQTQTI